MSIDVKRVCTWATAVAAAVLCFNMIGQAALAQSAASGQSAAYPAADRDWGSNDYAALADLVSSGRAPLPTLADPSTRPVFERLVAEHDVSLDMQARKQGTPQLRMQELLPTLAALQKLTYAYLSADQSGKPVERELAKMMASLLAHSAAMSDVVAEILPTVPHDSAYEARMKGLEQMRRGLREILAGAVDSIGDPGFSKASRLELIAAVKTHLPSFQTAMTEATRADLARQLTDDVGKTTDQELKAALTDLEHAISRP